MKSGGGIPTVCRALLAAMGIALGITGAGADDLVGSDEIGASDDDDAASMAAGDGHRLWSRQPGTSDADFAEGVATDRDGNVYVVGQTFGALGGANEGGFDAWVIKFDGDGHRLWARQPGTSDFDVAHHVATDKNGNVYVVGETAGALGGANKGIGDAWVIKFDGDGHVLWSRQPGTRGGDQAFGVATDADGNVHVVGFTDGALGGPSKGGGDGWVITFDGDGHVLWTRQPGTSDFDVAHDVATDKNGNVYVVGSTDGALGGPNKGIGDAWVIKFNGDGHRLWSRQPGTSDWDSANGVATDRDGNVSVVGFTHGRPGSIGLLDGWVIEYDGDGHRLWTRQPRTSDDDSANGVATDPDGNVSVVGFTGGALGGPNKGNGDAWAIKFNSDGHRLWTRQPGTSDDDSARGVATDRDGNVYVVGFTAGALGGPNKGGFDAWVIKYAR